MSVCLVPEIWCDVCDCRSQTEHNVDIDGLATWATDTRFLFAGEGWRRGDGLDLCPPCAAEREGDSDE